MGTFEDLLADGQSSRVYRSSPASGPGPAVVVLHPWWGLNADVTAFADRLAGAGFTVTAPDLYGGPTATTIEEAERLSDRMDQAAANALALAATDLALAAGPGAPVATVGFSMGAAWALWLGAERPRVVATVVYYGSLSGPSLGRGHAPVLGHFAESDPYEEPAGVAAFGNALRAAGREVMLHHYAGTGHWFAEPGRPEYDAAAAELAFERTVAFLRERLGEG